jgi:hypothetical protein
MIKYSRIFTFVRILLVSTFLWSSHAAILRSTRLLVPGVALHHDAVYAQGNGPAVAKLFIPVIHVPTIPIELPKFVMVNVHDRDDVKRVYRDVYLASLAVPMGWTGDHAACKAGTVAPAYLEALRVQINYFRAMAGVPAEVVFSDEYNQYAQEAALMMSVAGALSHEPTQNWKCYSVGGYIGASHSNLSLGSVHFIDDFIPGTIRDDGANNASVGHRRWLLLPEQQFMGVGSVAPDPETQLAAHATYVVGDELYSRPIQGTHRGRIQPPTREVYVAWPPPGYVPQELIYPRWSFSYPYPKVRYESLPDGWWTGSLNVDMAGATVDVLLDGQPVDVVIEHATPVEEFSALLPTLVWNPQVDWAELDESQDHAVDVRINGILIDGEAHEFHYTVHIFDPQVNGGDGS